MAINAFGEPRIEDDNAVESPTELPIKRNEKFILTHSDSQWFHTTAGWLPQLSEVPLKPGANGITGMDHKRDPSAFLGAMMRSGGVVINPRDPRLGPYKNYVRSYPCKGGAKYYVLPWMRPEVLNNRVSWITDSKGHYGFLQYLVDQGLIEDMKPIALRRALEVQEKRIENLERRVATPTGGVLLHRLEAAKAKRDAMIVDYERQFGEVEALETSRVQTLPAGAVDDLDDELASVPAAAPKRGPGRPKALRVEESP